MDRNTIHSLIMTRYRMSKRKSLTDNLPFNAKRGGRDRLAQIFAEVGYQKGAEIGVKKGQFSEVMCNANPTLQLYCVDSWSEIEPYGGKQIIHDKHYREATKRLNPYNVTFIRKNSMDALPDFKDESLDFVYIDANHQFDYVVSDIIGWSKKVRSGGIVSGHDYFNHHKGGVVKAVDAYTHCHNIRPWFVTEEIWPSWFWVKP